MNLLTRHIIKEIVVATTIAMGLFIFVLLIGNALRDVASLVASGRLDAILFLKLIGLLIPFVGAYALPLGVLTGTLIALGRLSSQREIIAMKSAGISMLQVAAPVLFVAFAGMILTVLVNFQYAPKSRVMYKEMLADAILDNPVNFIEEKRFIKDFPGIIFYIDRKVGNKVFGFWAWELDEQKRVRRFARAEEGEIIYDEEALKLVLVLRNIAAELREGDDLEVFGSDVIPPTIGETSLALPLDNILGPRKRKERLSEMTLNQLLEARDEALEAEQTEGTGMSQRRLRVQLQIQKNFAMAFSVFSLAIFGVPLAIQVGRKETHANLAIAVVLAISYYFLMIVVTWFENNIALRPDLLIWLPNIVFQLLGVYALRRIMQH